MFPNIVIYANNKIAKIGFFLSIAKNSFFHTGSCSLFQNQTAEGVVDRIFEYEKISIVADIDTVP